MLQSRQAKPTGKADRQSRQAKPTGKEKTPGQTRLSGEVYIHTENVGATFPGSRQTLRMIHIKNGTVELSGSDIQSSGKSHGDPTDRQFADQHSVGPLRTLRHHFTRGT